MEDLKKALEVLANDFKTLLKDGKAEKQLEEIRISLLGKKGRLTKILKGMGQLSEKERPVIGQYANEVRTIIEEGIAKIKKQSDMFEMEQRMKQETIDISMPGTGSKIGGRHPLNQVIQEIYEIFIGMGFSIAEGPEVEYSKYNFDLLRITEGHPARDPQDTFYITDEILLRTQTSPVQIRVMENQKPPIRVICAGKVFRSDALDATHSPVFHQIEGLVVDEGVTMADLVGVLETFAKKLFGEETKIRLRPHHFPFTEPSCEVDISCWTCHGESDHCSTCRGEGWIEVLGAGMVHPEVLQNCGIDPEKYSGFAFGIGSERTAMGRFGIADIRMFYENNLKFLQQFR